MSGTIEVAPAAVPPGPADRRVRSRATVLFPVAVVAVVLLTVGVCLALTRDDGATTPEAALNQLVEAVESGDANEVLLALPPAERLAIADGLPDLADHLEALGLLQPGDGSAAALPRLSVDGLRVATTPYDENVAAVDLIGGTVTVELGPGDDLPLTEAGQELLAGPDGTVAPGTTTVTRDLAQEPIRLIAIREGGGWHISVAYSIVDAMVADGGVAVPAMGNGPFPYGAETAEAAVVDFVRAYADGYLDRLVTLLASDEARSLYDYAPVILPGTSKLVEDLMLMGAYDVQLNSIDTSVEGSGDTRTVTITGLDLDIRDQVHKVHIVLADGCLHVDERIDDEDAPYAVYDICAGEWNDPDAGARPLDNPVGNAAVFGGGAELPTFTVVERNGRWFISPIRSLLDTTIGTLDRLGPDEQRAFLERLVRSARAGVGDGLIGEPLSPDLTAEERATTLIARCDALIDDDAVAPPPPENGSGGAEPAMTTSTTAPPSTSEPTDVAADPAGATADERDPRRGGAPRLHRPSRAHRFDRVGHDPEDRRAGLAPPPPPPG